jgi:hypothetical protein
MALKWRNHAILKPPTVEEMSVMQPQDLIRLHKVYHEAISNSEGDPYRYGFVLPNWNVVQEWLGKVDTVLALGGNRAAKTQLGAWMVVKACMNNPQSLIVCFAQNAELSVLVQQTAVFHHLPVELKRKQLGQEEYVSYTKQNGFAGNSVIFANGSRILFKTYSQFQQNQTVLEGLELGCYAPTVPNLGAWCDEYLGGPDLINTLSFRLATRNAKMLLTFTPIDGYTETVRQYLEGAKTIEEKPAELLNNKMVPYVQRCVKQDAAIIYLHTKDNPFSGYERVAKEALAKGDEQWVLCRLYGIPTKSMATKFPLFNPTINVVSHDLIPRKGVTRYLILDPAGSKNWFMLWIAVDEDGTFWVYREWPDVNVGDWATWAGRKWSYGDGAKGLGYGIRDYVDLITRSEENEQIFERLIDPRAGAAKRPGLTGASSIIEELEDAGLLFVPAPGLEIEDGIQAIQTKMAYNPKVPVDSANHPHFYISDRCVNTIASLKEYTGAAGPEEAWKDPIDCLRYAATTPCVYIDPTGMKTTGKKRGY